MKSHLSLTYPKVFSGPGSLLNSQKKRKTPASASTGEEYKCKDCDKGFPCMSSYWGHLRWHRSVPDESNNNINIDDNAREDVQINHAAHLLIALSRMDCSCHHFPGVNFEDRFGLEEMKGKHECSICHEIFSTRNALGGHLKSAHLPLVPNSAGKSKVLMKKPELVFDLNAEPPEDSCHPSDKVVVGEASS
jgi:C2H2-type zinc finger